MCAIRGPRRASSDPRTGCPTPLLRRRPERRAVRVPGLRSATRGSPPRAPRARVPRIGTAALASPRTGTAARPVPTAPASRPAASTGPTTSTTAVRDPRPSVSTARSRRRVRWPRGMLSSFTSPYAGVCAVAPKPIASTDNSSPSARVGTAVATVMILRPGVDDLPGTAYSAAEGFLFRQTTLWDSNAKTFRTARLET
jgi:hypothetical protein